ncbi:hypothetical protein [Thioalkalivibrio sp. ALMg9]|uniref:hypothetical protein n=1 Tax=Thioalkalivibrio sp. ALMg9 TaxID=1266912 RepID=UPI00036B9789|nr:hypothetical protein [Thioalkalivibrio sp. ALMg9]
MLFPIDVLGYVLAASVGVAGPTGARLNNTGEVRAAARSMPLLVTVLTILYGVSGFSAVFYFSWAHLNWIQIVSFFVVWFLLGDRLAKAGNGSVVWTAFILSVLLAGLSQILIVVG